MKQGPASARKTGPCRLFARGLLLRELAADHAVLVQRRVQVEVETGRVRQDGRGSTSAHLHVRDRQDDAPGRRHNRGLQRDRQLHHRRAHGAGRALLDVARENHRPRIERRRQQARLDESANLEAEARGVGAGGRGNHRDRQRTSGGSLEARRRRHVRGAGEVRRERHLAGRRRHGIQGFVTPSRTQAEGDSEDSKALHGGDSSCSK